MPSAAAAPHRVYPAEAIQHQPLPPPRRGSGDCWCVALVFLLVVGILAVPPYLVSYSDPQVHIAAFEASNVNLSAPQIMADWNIDFYVRNGNKHLRFSYTDVTALVLYGGDRTNVAAMSLAAFRQGGSNTTLVRANLASLSGHVEGGTLSAIAKDMDNGWVSFNVLLQFHLKVKGRVFWVRTFMAVYCEGLSLVVPSNTTMAGRRLDAQPRKCKRQF